MMQSLDDPQIKMLFFQKRCQSLEYCFLGRKSRGIVFCPPEILRSVLVFSLGEGMTEKGFLILFQKILDPRDIDSVNADVFCHSNIVIKETEKRNRIRTCLLVFSAIIKIRIAGAFPASSSILAEMCVWLHTIMEGGRGCA